MPDPQDHPRPPADLTPTLVARLREGSATAGRMLTELYHPPLMRFCYRYLGSREEAEDVVQEVFLKVLDTRVMPDNFRAWVYKIARNRCLDLIRARGRRREDQNLESASRVEEDLTGCLTRLVRHEQRAHLRRALASLSENHREVLHLRYAEELSRSEIAQVLGIPEPLVKSRLYEGMVQLRAHDSLVDPS